MSSGDADRGRVLVAGIGNVFFGDDAFGVEVVNRIEPGSLPETVDVEEYGIRGVHLAYELLKGRHDTLILVDAAPLGEPAGTLAVLEVGLEVGEDDGAPEASADPSALDTPGVDAHTMTPDAVLRILQTLGGHVERVFVVGCQPAVFDQGMQLSPQVCAAVDQAAKLVVELATNQATRAPNANLTSTANPLRVG